MSIFPNGYDVTASAMTSVLTREIYTQMQRDLTEFAKFYIELHQGRKLDWDHSSGTATLKAQFNKGEKELTVSLYQAIVLLLFNEEPQRTYAEIKEHTHLGKFTSAFAFPMVW